MKQKPAERPASPERIIRNIKRISLLAKYVAGRLPDNISEKF